MIHLFEVVNILTIYHCIVHFATARPWHFYFCVSVKMENEHKIICMYFRQQQTVPRSIKLCIHIFSLCVVDFSRIFLPFIYFGFQFQSRRSFKHTYSSQTPAV